MPKKVNYKDILTRILLIWIVCFGAITLQVVAGYYMSHLLLPYLGFFLILCIIAFGNYNLHHYTVNCSKLTHYTVYVLAVCGVIMLVANLLNTNFITNRYSEFSHRDFPFHTAFIIYPVATLIFGLGMLRKTKPNYCNACRTMSEFSVRESLRRTVLHHEAKVHMRLAFGICLFLTCSTYIYYYLFYKSGELSRLYSPDVFFMYILPGAAYVLSVIYVVSRYFSVEFEISLKMAKEEENHKSRVRVMVVWREQLLLKDMEVSDSKMKLWDTPADFPVDAFGDISILMAQRAFEKAYGSPDFKIRKLFTSNSKQKMILHCAAFLDDDTESPNSMSGHWFSLREVDMMLKSGAIARPFALELHRVFTITMAWKTYDREGRRLYPIKNYRPTFRLRDFKDWDVDYEDTQWINVSENNQDRPFYNFRRFWRRYINGMDQRWNRDS